MERPADLSVHPDEFRVFGGGTGDEIWAMLNAAHNGDAGAIRRMTDARPELVDCEYNYTRPIHLAVREGHAEVARLLLERGADPAYQSYMFDDDLLQMARDRGYDGIADLVYDALRARFDFRDDAASLLVAVDAGDQAALKKIFAERPELVSAANTLGETALHRAVRRSDFDLVRQLLAWGAPVDARRGDGTRALHLALEHPGSKRPYADGLRAGSIAGYLLANGAEYTLYAAVVLNDAPTVERILRTDPGQANRPDSNGRRPITPAASRGDVEMLRKLLTAGADPNAAVPGGPRGDALWQAVWNQHLEVVRLLLLHGADPNAPVESSGRPIDFARDPEMRALLVEHGGVEHSDEQSSLLSAISRGDTAAVAPILEAHPNWLGDPNAFWGEGVLSVPANKADVPMLELLMECGAKAPPVTKWARSYYFKHEHIARLLLERGAIDPNHRNWLQITILHDMAHAGDLRKAELLLDHGADINAIDDEYRSTPLGFAARFGHLSMVCFLLERGADPTAAGAPWAGPAEWAQKRGHVQIVDVLRSPGGRI